MAEMGEGPGQRAEAQEISVATVRDPSAQVDATEPPPRLAAKIMHPRKKRNKQPSRRDYVAVIRPLALFSAFLGLFSLVLPWMFEADSSYGNYHSLWSYVSVASSHGPLHYNFAFAVAAGLIFLGSMLCLLSPTGAFGTLAGLVIFAFEARADFGSMTAGFYVALIAAALGLSAIVFERPLKMWDRLVVFCPKDQGRIIRVNLLALAAAALALIAVMLPWAIHSEGILGGNQRSTSISLLSFADSNFYFGSLGLSIASSLFILGAILCIFTQLATIPMLFGVGWTLFELIPEMGSVEMSWYSESFHLSYGGILGVVAVAVGLLSLVFRVDLRIANRLTVGQRAEPEGPSPTEVPEERQLHHETPDLKRLASHWRKIAAVAIVIGAVIAFAGLTYAMPWCKIEVRVSNMSQSGLNAFAVAYLDGEEMRSGFISPQGVLIADMTSTAGLHRISLDYGEAEGHLPALDGVPDWTTDVKANPFQKRMIIVDILYEEWHAPELTVISEDIQDGQKVTVASIEQWFSGVQRPGSLSWIDVTIILWDGIRSASWSPTATALTDYAKVANWSSDVQFGNLSVECTVIDLLGNGYMNAGDYFTITTVGGSAFSPETPYVIFIMDDSTSSLLAEVGFSGV